MARHHSGGPHKADMLLVLPFLVMGSMAWGLWKLSSGTFLIALVVAIACAIAAVLAIIIPVFRLVFSRHKEKTSRTASDKDRLSVARSLLAADEAEDEPIHGPACVKVEVESTPSSVTVPPIIVPSTKKGDAPAATPTQCIDSSEFPLLFVGLIRTYAYDDVQVAGATYYDGITRARVGDNIKLVPEPNNEYDANAVAFYVGDGKIGHLHKGGLQKMYHDFTKRDGTVHAVVSGIEPDGITMSMAYYDDPKYVYDKLVRRNAEYKLFKLNGARKQEYQDNIALCSVGDYVEPVMDYEKDHILASCGDYIGFFPKPAERYFENDSPLVFVHAIDDDIEKSTVTVSIFPRSSHVIL